MKIPAMVRLALRERGFTARGKKFFREEPTGNTLTMAFQSSRSSSAQRTLVTINCGVYSARIGRTIGESPEFATDVTLAHWQDRLTEGRQEQWLELLASDGEERHGQLLLDGALRLLSVLERHATDEALRDLWLTGRGGGLMDHERLVYLALLLAALGPQDRLASTLHELAAAVAGHSVSEHRAATILARAGLALPR